MTTLTAHPLNTPLTGTARIPGDKSISHRSLMMTALAKGVSKITGLLEGEDVICTAHALEAMGAKITRPSLPGGDWVVEGTGKLTSTDTPIDLGNSGTSTRLLMGLAAGYGVAVTFTGDASLSKRPMARVMAPLEKMGARFTAADGGRLPLTLHETATLQAIDYTLPVASAQVKSAIILAGLNAKGKTRVTEPVPTRDHTERMLRHFGVAISTEALEGGAVRHRITGGATLTARDITVPGDPSSAAFIVVAALITAGSDITIPCISVNPLRTGLYTTLIEMGAAIEFNNERLLCGEPVADLRVRSSALKGVTVPSARASSMIDEFPILSIAAAFASGTTHMSNLAELRVKESDRLAAIARGLAACGVTCDSGDDWLTVTGGTPRGGAVITTELDHRIAMSFLVMGLATQNAVTVDDGSPITTSFPGFTSLMNSLGASIA